MASNKPKPLSKTLVVKCGYCGPEMLERNLKPHCRGQHSSAKYVQGDTRITSYFGKGKKRKLSTSETVNDPKPESSENLCSEELGEKGLGTELNLKADTESTAGLANEPTASTANNANDKLDEILLLSGS